MEESSPEEISSAAGLTREEHAYFWRGQVRPRGKSLICHPLVPISLGLGILFSLLLYVLPGGHEPISTFAQFGLTFASISLGACIAAVVLSLGVPGPERVRIWATTEGAHKGFSTLSELIFVFSWAALSQLVLATVSCLSIAFGGGLPIAAAFFPNVFFLAFSLFTFFYALSQLFIAVQTLVQLGVAIILDEGK